MTLPELIGDSVRRSTMEVFTTMVGMDARPGEQSIEQGAPVANDGVLALIGLAGRWIGTGSVSCSPTLACRICSQMLMVESTSVNEEVLDAIAEVTNMVIGGAKNELEAHVGPLGLSIPTVVFGRNFRTKSAGMAEWVNVHFDIDGEQLAVKLCLAPAERPDSHKFAHLEHDYLTKG